MTFNVLLTVILIPLLTGMEVDLFMGVHALWSQFVAAESLGHKLMNEAGLSHYTFRLIAHVYKSGMIIGVMCEPIIGRKLKLYVMPLFALTSCRSCVSYGPCCCFRSSS
jgi:hypothetical protein